VLLRSTVLLAVSVLLLALLIRRLAPYFPAWGATGATWLLPETRETWEAIAAGVGALLALGAPRLGRRTFGRVERAFSRFAVHRTHAILAAAAFPVVVRLALLPLIPIPQPFVPDEFGHLLLADTFGSGHITNPTHPLWRHFETLYVFHQPTYTSQYPIAQGLMLAVPVALHAHPWFGVCLSIALMGAALCWMLQGWLPPKWALLGALLAGARWGIVTYWINSYWGGAAGAIGGALLLGALPRLLRRDRMLAALWAGIGLFVLSQSRPFEGFLLSLPVGAWLLVRLLNKPREHARVLATLAAVSCVAAAFVLSYNWQVTGKPLQIPYQLHQQIYGTPQNLLWSAPITNASRVKQHSDIWENFEWQLGLFQDQSSWEGIAEALPRKLESFWEFYFLPISTLPLLLLPLALRRGRIRFLFFTVLFVLLAGFVLYPFYFPHYSAPLSSALLVLTLQGARCLRTLRWPRPGFGAALFRWSLAIPGVAIGSQLVLAGMLCPACVSTGVTARSRVAEELQRRGGKHLVLVRYAPTHDYNYPWIYNSAAIDESPVIWARELDETKVTELFRRYPDREAWLVSADDPSPELILYADKDRPRISAILNAAGKGPFFKEGVAPGSIVTLFGTNLAASVESRAGACAISPPRGIAREHGPTQLPGFDGSRPGVVIPGLEEPVPAMTIEQSGLEAGGIFRLIEESGKRPDPGEPKTLRVRFGALPGTVLCVESSGSAASVTVLVPPELAGDSVNITLSSAGHESKSKAFPVLPANPGILQTSQSGSLSGKTAGVVLHANGDLVTPGNPARRGEILRMFLTGAGAPGANGPQFPFIVGVNNRGAPLRGVNCAACRSGIAELRFEVPQESPSGSEIPLSAAVVANGKPVYSNSTTFAVQ
jgi:uncharacterized protein (TIGR03437 family)